MIGGARIKLCELCGAQADVHCAADAAFLCHRCDDKVHGANFLVTRHIRQKICPNCNSLSGNFMSGAVSRGFSRTSACCRSCSTQSYSSSCSSSLDCVSSCELSSTAAGENRKKTIGSRTRRKGRIHGEAKSIFVNWCEKLGLNGKYKSSVVSSACEGLGLCLERLNPVLPLRVNLAASFWFGVRIMSGERSAAETWQNLRRLEEVSSVPNKLIVAVEARLARGMRLRRPRLDLEEGWAECDNA